TTLGDAATDEITVTGEILGANPLNFEGATNDDVYTTLAITDPSGANTITFPDASGTVALDNNGTSALTTAEVDQLENIGINTISSVQWGHLGNSNQGIATTDNVTFADLSTTGNTTLGNAATDQITVTGEIVGGNPLVFEGATNDDVYTTLAVTDPSGANTLTLPDQSGTLAVTADVTLDAAYGQNATITADDTDGNLVVNLTETTDFVIQDNGSPFVTATDAGQFDVDNIRLDGSTVAGTTGLNLDASANNVSIDAAAGSINIGSDAVAQPINIGTGASNRTITMGNASQTSSVVVNSDATNTASAAAIVNGGLAISNYTETITGTAGTLTVANRSFITITDSHAGATTFSLSSGNTAGQMLVLVMASSDGITLADSGNVRLSVAWTPDADDTITLIWNGSSWFELYRSAN
ncbi:MAG: hypothetical protein NXI20_25800, partial [bacterium]|nr:hypothetical protein [bacterium]